MSLVSKRTNCFDCDKGQLKRTSGYDSADASPIVVYWCDRCKATKKVWLSSTDMRHMQYTWTSGKQKFYFKPTAKAGKQ